MFEIEGGKKSSLQCRIFSMQKKKEKKNNSKNIAKQKKI